jgi:hypothetical protein
MKSPIRGSVSYQQRALSLGLDAVNKVLCTEFASSREVGGGNRPHPFKAFGFRLGRNGGEACQRWNPLFRGSVSYQKRVVDLVLLFHLGVFQALKGSCAQGGGCLSPRDGN